MFILQISKNVVCFINHDFNLNYKFLRAFDTDPFLKGVIMIIRITSYDSLSVSLVILKFTFTESYNRAR